MIYPDIKKSLPQAKAFDDEGWELVVPHPKPFFGLE